jgi:hypothetical protein
MALPRVKVQRDISSENTGVACVTILVASATGKVRENSYSLMKIKSYSHIKAAANCKDTEQYESEQKNPSQYSITKL